MMRIEGKCYFTLGSCIWVLVCVNSEATLLAVLAAYKLAISGLSCHIASTNESEDLVDNGPITVDFVTRSKSTMWQGVTISESLDSGH